MRLIPENTSAARYTAVMGLLFAVTAALNMIESVFSAALPAGIRIGLSNIVIMAAIMCINLPSAAVLTVLKSAFVLMTRGVTAGAISLCGGILAFGVTALLFRKTRATYILISVLAAVVHSMGQLLCAGFMMETAAVFGYAPILVVCSAVAGVCTGIVLKAVFPALERTLYKTKGGL